jgi:phosphate uptake regulator
MRAVFADELLEIEQRLRFEFDAIGSELRSIADTILDSVSHDAPRLIAAARSLRAARRLVDERLVAVTARQAPVAGDLRLVLSLIQLAQHAALIANQFELISQQLDELDPDARDPQHTAGVSCR